MMMRGLTAGDFCLLVLQPQIDDLGATAFAHSDLVVLYSGPTQAIQNQMADKASNPERSAEQAKRLQASRIDDTAVAVLLDSIDLYAYFDDTYDQEQDVYNAVRDVWAYASRQFMRAGFCAVATSVCGADPERVFRAHELKVMLTEDTAIETINGVPLRHYKDIFDTHGKGNAGFYAAFVEICRTELVVAHQRVTSAASDDEKTDALEDYTTRKLFFDLEQVATLQTTASIAFIAMSDHHAALVATDPVRPSDQSLPSAPSPNGAVRH